MSVKYWYLNGIVSSPHRPSGLVIKERRIPHPNLELRAPFNRIRRHIERPIIINQLQGNNIPWLRLDLREREIQNRPSGRILVQPRPVLLQAEVGHAPLEPRGDERQVHHGGLGGGLARVLPHLLPHDAQHDGGGRVRHTLDFRQRPGQPEDPCKVHVSKWGEGCVANILLGCHWLFRNCALEVGQVRGAGYEAGTR